MGDTAQVFAAWSCFYHWAEISWHVWTALIRYSVRNLSFISLSLNFSNSRMPRYQESLCSLADTCNLRHQLPLSSVYLWQWYPHFYFTQLPPLQHHNTTFLYPKFHSYVLANQLYCPYKALSLCFILPIDLQVIHKEQMIYFDAS